MVLCQLTLGQRIVVYLLGHIANIFLNGHTVNYEDQAFSQILVLVNEFTAKSLIARNIHDTYVTLELHIGLWLLFYFNTLWHQSNPTHALYFVVKYIWNCT